MDDMPATERTVAAGAPAPGGFRVEMRDAGVMVVTLCRPARLNALTQAMKRDLIELMTAAQMGLSKRPGNSASARRIRSRNCETQKLSRMNAMRMGRRANTAMIAPLVKHRPARKAGRLPG